MPVTLPALALDTSIGEALVRRCVRRAALYTLANDRSMSEEAVAAALYEEADGGQAMTETVLAELGEEEARRIGVWARDHALRRCEIAAGELEAAAASLRVDADPAAIALLAAGPAVGRAIR